MVRAPNQGARPTGREDARRDRLRVLNLPQRVRTYFAPVALPYFLRNLSTRPAVSTIFCLPV